MDAGHESFPEPGSAPRHGCNTAEQLGLEPRATGIRMLTREERRHVREHPFEPTAERVTVRQLVPRGPSVSATVIALPGRGEREALALEERLGRPREASTEEPVELAVDVTKRSRDVGDLELDSRHLAIDLGHPSSLVRVHVDTVVWKKQLKRPLAFTDTLPQVLLKCEGLECELHDRAPSAEDRERIGVDLDTADRVRVSRALPEDEHPQSLATEERGREQRLEAGAEDDDVVEARPHGSQTSGATRARSGSPLGTVTFRGFSVIAPIAIW